MNDVQQAMWASMRVPLAMMSMASDWMTQMMNAFSAGPGGAPPGVPMPVPQLPGAPGKESTMRDHDLSGDGVKLVRWRVLFTKREYEVAFPEEDAVLTYDAGAAEYGGQKLAEFFAAAQAGAVPRPAVWQEKDYPPGAGDDGWTIPEEDRRYVRFHFRVVDRFDRQPANYAKDQVEVLREISAKIG